MSKLDKLKKLTTVVSDTGDIHSIQKYTPTDATTNPSLIFTAAQEKQYQHLLDDAIRYGMEKSADRARMMGFIMDKLFVNFGIEILKLIPGRVSTEVDARLSYDTKASIDKAVALVNLYENAGIKRERILIKLASTWEGIEAARHLQKEGIQCNMTLLFNLTQAIASAEAGARLISPFVGRILDWYKAAEGVAGYPPEKDPGVLSVQRIYNYYKKFGYETQIMGASFRNVDEVLQLAGCDFLTIAPKLLEELQQAEGDVPRKLEVAAAKKMEIKKMSIDERSFRWDLNEDQMAYEKLGDGIRRFAADTVKLEKFITDRITVLAK